MEVPTEWYRELGRKGGKASGECKLRGDRDYYVRIAQKSAAKRKAAKALAK